MDRARCLVSEAKINKSYWTKCIYTAKLLTNTNIRKRPYEIFFNNKQLQISEYMESVENGSYIQKLLRINLLDTQIWWSCEVVEKKTAKCLMFTNAENDDSNKTRSSETKE
ncbi:hypothetical protein PR048_023629 [Dryococelus australis]|uniref:Uncharacterized protein n=1 Tax=Dryococelus australis TaxID=614101 RepID=A0ABQ9GUM5_9NEOP|nr:hypothetical protein PR048_023629 [Dryococelus australis]